jgi:hypothetical protein
MHGRRLYKRSVRRWHGLAAILTMVAVRRTMHGVAALYRLCWRRRRPTVECIRSERDREDRPKKWPGYMHHSPAYAPTVFESIARLSIARINLEEWRSIRSHPSHRLCSVCSV